MPGLKKTFFIFIVLVIGILLIVGFLALQRKESSLESILLEQRDLSLPLRPFLPSEDLLLETTTSGWITEVNAAAGFFLFRSRTNKEYRVVVNKDTKLVSYAPPPSYTQHIGVYLDEQIVPIAIEELRNNEQVSIRFFSPLEFASIIDNAIEVTVFRQYE